MINTNLLKVIQLNENILMRYCDAARIMAAYCWSMTTVTQYSV